MAMLDEAAHFIICKTSQTNVTLNMTICEVESARQPPVILAPSVKCTAVFHAGHCALTEQAFADLTINQLELRKTATPHLLAASESAVRWSESVMKPGT